MATSGSWDFSWKSGYWNTSDNTKYYHWSGNWSKSGNTITLSSQKLWMTFAKTSSAYGTQDSVKTGKSGSMSSAQTVTWNFSSVKTSPKVSLNNKSFTVGASDTSVTIRCEISGETTGTKSISFDATNVAPATPTCTPTASSASLINITWGTTDLGTPTGTVSLYNGTTNNPTNLLQTKSTTGTNVFGNDQRTANTTYYYKATATNSVGTVSSAVASATTLPAGISSITGSSLTANSIVLTLVFASSGSALTTTAQVSSNNSTWNDTSLTNVQGTTQTYGVTGLNANTQYTRYFRVHTTAGNSGVESFTWTTKPAGITSTAVSDITGYSANVAVTCGTSGVAATTDLQISTDNVTWTTVANNVQGTTVTVPVTGLTPNTAITRYFRVHTVYGNSAVSTVTFTTLQVAHLYGSVNNQTKQVKKLYGSVNGQTKEVKKLYGSVNGVTKLIYQG